MASSRTQHYHINITPLPTMLRAVRRLMHLASTGTHGDGPLLASAAMLMLQGLLEEGIRCIVHESDGMLDKQATLALPIRRRLHHLDKELQAGFFNRRGKSSTYAALYRLISSRNKVAHAQMALGVVVETKDGEVVEMTDARTGKAISELTLKDFEAAMWWFKTSVDDVRAYEAAVVEFITAFNADLFRPEYPRDPREDWEPTKPLGS